MTNIEKLMEKIPDGQTCAVVTDEINRRYFTGFKSSDGVFICFKEKAYFIIDFRYYEKAAKVVTGCEVIMQKERKEQMNELFARHGVKTVMIESMTMTVNGLRNFVSDFPDIDVDYSDSLSRIISDLRLIKTKEETEKIRAAQKIAEETFLYMLDTVKEGMTEREMALIMDNRMKSMGAEDISFETIALTGRNTSLPHGVPGSDKVCRNSFVLMDFGAVIDGLHSDMTRTFYVGTPSDEEREAYQTVLEAQLKALDSIRPNMNCRDLDAVAREHIDSSAFKGCFGHSLGHGVGMEIHEEPAVSRKSESILLSGMVVTVEPGIYIPEKFGIRIEDMVVITDDLYINLTSSPKELITL